MESQAILDEYARYKNVVENLKDVIWEMDPQLVFTFVGASIKGLAGYEPQDLVGRHLFEFVTKESAQSVLEQKRKRMENWERYLATDPPLYDTEFLCKDGSIIWCEICVKPLFEGDRLIGYAGATRDITAKKQYEQRLQEMLAEQQRVNSQLEEMLTYDQLTGAYNRRMLEQFAGQEIGKATKFGTPFSLCIFDVDNFKHINDTEGHNKGDCVLSEIAALIRDTLRAADKLFRWGGDEFILLFAGTEMKNALRVADKVRETIALHPLEVQSRHVTVSMGVGAWERGETVEQLVARVDRALLRAKRKGKNQVDVG